MNNKVNPDSLMVHRFDEDMKANSQQLVIPSSSVKNKDMDFV